MKPLLFVLMVAPAQDGPVIHDPPVPVLPQQYDAKCISQCAEANGGYVVDACFDRCDRESDQYQGNK